MRVPRRDQCSQTTAVDHEYVAIIFDDTILPSVSFSFDPEHETVTADRN
jgi:hypothetical protein